MKDRIIKLYNNVKIIDEDLAKNIIKKSARILPDLEEFVKQVDGDFIFLNKSEMESLINASINLPTEYIGNIGFKNKND